jgi:hypothetical protein
VGVGSVFSDGELTGNLFLQMQANLTQDEPAKVAGIPRTTLTTWERTGDT